MIISHRTKRDGKQIGDEIESFQAWLSLDHLALPSDKLLKQE
jgi:hypothetical protein